MTLSSEPVRVAEAIETLLGLPGAADPLGLLDEEAADAVRICLAEVLNNCIEHGYGGEPGHPIRVELGPLAQMDSGVELRISDRGRRPPAALLDAVQAGGAGRTLLPSEPLDAAALAALPEGGWGWPMIGQLADRIRFERVGDWNVLILETAGER